MRDWGGGGGLNITAQNPAIGAASGNAIKRNIPISGNPARQRAGKDLRLIAAFGLGAGAAAGYWCCVHWCGRWFWFGVLLLRLATDGKGAAGDDF